MKAKYLVLVLIFLLEGLAAGASCTIGRTRGPRFTTVHGWADTFHNTTTGGHWSSSDTNILVFSRIDSTYAISRSRHEGVVLLTYSLSGACAGTYDTLSVRVITGTHGSTKLCVNGFTYLRHVQNNCDAFGTWTSSNPSVATVNSEGKVFGVSVGASIIAHTYEIGYDTSGSGRFLYQTMHDSVFVRNPSGSLTQHLRDTMFCNYHDIPSITFASSDTLLWDFRFCGYSIYHSYDDPCDYARGHINILDPGQYTLIYGLYNCTTICDSIVMSVGPFDLRPRTIRPISFMCYGDTVTLIKDRNDIPGYWWNYGGTSPIDSVTGLVTNIGAGTMYFTYHAYDTNCVERSDAGIHMLNTSIISGPSTIPTGVTSTYVTYGFDVHTAWSIDSTLHTFLDTAFHSGSYAQANLLGLWPDTIALTSINSYCHDTVTRNIAITGSSRPYYGRLIGAYIHRDECDTLVLANLISPHLGVYKLITHYGDGRADTVSLVASIRNEYIYSPHSYRTAGTYTIKQILLDSASLRIDSVTYFGNVLPCNSVHLSFYSDTNRNCSFDSLEQYSSIGKRIGVDSNGVRIDTIIGTNVLHFNCRAPIGTNFALRSLDRSVAFNCFSDSVYRFVVDSGRHGHSANISIYADTTSCDVRVSSNFTVGRHAILGTININNTSDLLLSAVLTYKHIPGYTISSETHRSIFTDTTMSWRFDSLGAHATRTISFWLERSTGFAWHAPGVLMSNLISILPIGMTDVDTSNNQNDRIDTVKSSWDPNMIVPTPAGRIFGDTKIEYFVEFENDGNDTAHNIFVLDTLDSDLDLSTMEIIGSSATMHTERIRHSSLNIMKFSFPNIKLPDSSHHGQCRGHFIYTIKPRAGLANFTNIMARVGIYFDDNEVVMTPEAENTIIIPGDTIHAVRSGVFCAGEAYRFHSTYNSVANTHFQWFKNGVSVGGDSSVYIASTLARGDIVNSKMLSIVARDTIRTNTNSFTVSVFPHTGVDTIAGFNYICDTSSIVLSNATPGGIWSVSTGNARINSSGVLRGVSTGLDTVKYRVNNVCYTDTAVHPVSIQVRAHPSINIVAAPGDSLCGGIAVTFSSTITNGGSMPAYRWRLFGTLVDSGSTYTYMPSLGDVITCNLLSNMQCIDSPVVTSNSIDMLIIPSVTPRIDVVVIPADSVTSIGQMVNYFASVSFGGSTTNYQWVVNGSPVAGATSNTYARRAYRTDSVWCTTVSDAACATITNARSNKFAVKVPSLSIADIGGQSPTLSLYPNPNNGICTLESKDGAVYSGSYTIEIRNITGSLLYSANTTAYNGRISLQLNLQHMLAQGAYILKLVGGERAEHLPFIIHQ